jgi:hypoxanthine phosphoribosyltransferase
MNFPIYTFDQVDYVVPSWDQMGDVNFKLIKAVRDAGKKYDRVVALSKGGLTWARAFVDGLSMDELSSLRIKLYKGINQKSASPEILDPLTADIKGKTILLFDDVVDTGETYQFAKQLLLEKYGAKRVDTAALFYKPHAVIKPDFFSAETTAWIVFPHEINEFIQETGQKWRADGLSENEILRRYQEMNLSMEQCKYYLKALFF